MPLALLCLLGTGRSLADWFSARPAPALTVARASAIGWILRVTTGLLLIGHGGFDFAMHKDWTGYAAAIGISPATLAAHPLRPLAGWFECVLGLLVLHRRHPRPRLTELTMAFSDAVVMLGWMPQPQST